MIIHLSMIWLLITLLLCLFDIVDASLGFSSSVHTVEASKTMLDLGEQKSQGHHRIQRRHSEHYSKYGGSDGHWRKGIGRGEEEKKWRKRRRKPNERLSKTKVGGEKDSSRRYFRTSLKSALKKNGRIYAYSRQDWYSEYRRHHKLNLESPNRKKARFINIPNENDNKSGGNSDRTEDINIIGSGIGRASSLNKSESIQSIKTPKYVGPPIPES
ncbi:hypothetical protein BGZ49_004262, partial [Haplosporangium sp. Z 27]